MSDSIAFRPSECDSSVRNTRVLTWYRLGNETGDGMSAFVQMLVSGGMVKVRRLQVIPQFKNIDPPSKSDFCEIIVHVQK